MEETKMLTIGIEGPVFAGKTTLIKLLGENYGAGTVAEYGDYTKGSVNFPTFPPKTTEDILVAARFFANIEEERRRDYGRLMADHKTIVIDRTFLTCIAFDFAVSSLTGVNATAEVDAFWKNRPRIIPDVIVYLDITREEQSRRRSGRKPVPEHFLSEVFNQQFRSFFIDNALSLPAPLVVLNGNLPTQEVIDELKKTINWRD